MMHAHRAYFGPYEGTVAFPTPPQPSARAKRLLEGIARLQALEQEMAFRFIQLLDEAEGDADLEDDGSAEDADVDEESDPGEESDHGEDDGTAEQAEDDEYSLGRSEAINQSSYEAPADDKEWSLGWAENMDQRLISKRLDPKIAFAEQDFEEQCEDEGGQCDDEGAIEYETVYAPEYVITMAPPR